MKKRRKTLNGKPDYLVSEVSVTARDKKPKQNTAKQQTYALGLISRNARYRTTVNWV